MKALAIIAFALLFSTVRADSWSPPEPKASSSPSGRYVVRVTPGDWKTKKKPVAIVFELSRDGASYEKRREFPLLNAESPVDICISEAAEVFTFDDWGRMGYSFVVVWYSEEGQKKKEFTLEELFPPKPLAEIKEEHSSKSSIHWRGVGRARINGPHLIIPDVLGGYVSLTHGTIEYMPSESSRK